MGIGAIMSGYRSIRVSIERYWGEDSGKWDGTDFWDEAEDGMFL